MNKEEEIKNLIIDEVIWVIFIFLSIINLVGDECKKDYYVKSDTERETLSKKIFLFTLFVSFVIYIYVAFLKYKKVRYCYENNLDSACAEARLLASIMVVIASGIFLYCQIKESNPVNPAL